MAMPPFILFPTAELKHETINDILKETKFFDTQHFWLVTDTNYSKLPYNRSRGIPQRDYPISEFKSPFLDKSHKDLAEFLKGDPEGLALVHKFFAILDDRTGKDGSIMLCMIEDKEVLSFRHNANSGALYLGGISSLKFREGIENKYVLDL